MRRAIFIVSACLIGHFAGFAQIGVFDAEGDVGNPQSKGKVVYSSATQEYSVTGGGNNMYHAGDQFHFVWKKVTGDFIARARCKGYVKNGAEPDLNCKAGWMARKDLTGGSIYAGTGLHQKGLATLLYRAKDSHETGEVKDSTKITNTTPNITQLERKGNTYIMGLAIEGSAMHYDTLDTIARTITDDMACMDRPALLGDSVYLGFYVCSKNEGKLETWVFDSVTISGPTSTAPLFSVIQPTFSISVQSLIHNPELFSSITVVNGMGQDIVAGEPALFSTMIKRLGSGIYYVKARTLNGGTYNLKFVQR
jgi:TolB protein